MPLEFWLFDGPGVAPLVLGAGSEGRISRASADRVEMCRPRRQMAVEEWHTVGALEQLDLRISVPLKGARIAYKGLDHPPEPRVLKRAKRGRWISPSADAGFKAG